MCIFEMSKDIVFNYRGSWCSEGYKTPWAGSWRIVGTKGTITWEEGKPKAEVVHAKGEKLVYQMKEIESEPSPLELTGHRACINEFLQCLQEGGMPQTVCSDNINSLAMVFGAIESDSTGRPISLQPET